MIAAVPRGARVCVCVRALEDRAGDLIILRIVPFPVSDERRGMIGFKGLFEGLTFVSVGRKYLRTGILRGEG